MSQFICPSCGSEFFHELTDPTKNSFQSRNWSYNTTGQRKLRFLKEKAIDIHNIFCGACSWHGTLDDLAESDL